MKINGQQVRFVTTMFSHQAAHTGCPGDRKMKEASKADSLRRCHCISYAILAFLLAVAWRFSFVVSHLVEKWIEASASPASWSLCVWKRSAWQIQWSFSSWDSAQLFLKHGSRRSLSPCGLPCEDDFFADLHSLWVSYSAAIPSEPVISCQTTR